MSLSFFKKYFRINKIMHSSYVQKLKHAEDFRVKYKFYSEAEGGRQILPFQGIRSDFWYPHPNHKLNNIFMIWPEFEDENGDIILENDKSVNQQGTARMWIILPQRRSYHQDKIKVGIKGFFKEGNRSTGECEVIEIVGLSENPIK
jgi:hypothetical protein